MHRERELTDERALSRVELAGRRAHVDTPPPRSEVERRADDGGLLV
jgi:hypothetical protein